MLSPKSAANETITPIATPPGPHRRCGEVFPSAAAFRTPPAGPAPLLTAAGPARIPAAAGLARILTFTGLALLGAGLGRPAAASVEPVQQQRNVTTFALVDPLEGIVAMDNEQISSDQPGVFDERTEGEAMAGDAWARSWADQYSEIGGDELLVDAAFHGAASIGETASFAEAFGGTQLTFHFRVDTPIELALLGSMEAAGNGITNVLLASDQTGVLLYESIDDDVLQLEEAFPLGPGTYRFTASSGGYGQAFAEQENPASGSYSFRVHFPGAAEIPDPGENPAAFAMQIAPNPASRNATIRFAGPVPAGTALILFDATGRTVRRLTGMEGGSFHWDTEDDAGRPVAPGVYFARLDGSARGAEPARILVVR